MERPFLSKQLIIDLNLFEKYKKEINQMKREVKNDIQNPQCPTDLKAEYTRLRKQLGLSFNRYVELLGKKRFFERVLNYQLKSDAMAYCAGVSMEKYLPLYEKEEAANNRPTSYMEVVALKYDFHRQFQMATDADLNALSLRFQSLKQAHNPAVRYTTEAAFLVNTIRHEYSDWDIFLKHHRIQKESLDYLNLKALLLARIADHYPILTVECFSQLEKAMQVIRKTDASRAIMHESRVTTTETQTDSGSVSALPTNTWAGRKR